MENTRKVAPNSVVLAKIAGFPAWPASIVDPSTAPTKIQKLRNKEHSELVLFFGDASYSWVKSQEIVPFTESSLKKMKRPSKSLQAAIAEAKEFISKNGDDMALKDEYAPPKQSAPPIKIVLNQKRKKKVRRTKPIQKIRLRTTPTEEEVFNLKARMEKLIEGKAQENSTEATSVVDELSTLNMSFNLLQKTVIGKTLSQMKHFYYSSQKEIESGGENAGDLNDIVSKCVEIRDIWKPIVMEGSKNNKN